MKKNKSDQTETRVKELPNCDFCEQIGIITPAQFDAKTKQGPWANMCQPDMVEHSMFGIDGLGTGKGQRLVVD